MKFTPNNHTKSLGTLRINNKTKERLPDMTGTIKLNRKLIMAVSEQLKSTGKEEVICNLAGWQYRDKSGPLLNVEVSERYHPAQQEPENIFDLLAKQQDEE
jgi:hypothetical protein